MHITYYKCNGNGNSFLIFDKHLLPNRIKIDRSFIQTQCLVINKTDGLVVIDKVHSNEYNMDYYNNDGTWGSLCINAIRCIGLILNKLNNIHSVLINTHDADYHVLIDNNKLIKISLNKPIYETDLIKIGNHSGYYINSGAKHFVIEYNCAWPNDNILKEEAQLIRYDSYFPDGVNVNFYKVINRDNIEVKTYEKGIEKMMNSCASGSYACIYHLYNNNKINDSITVINDGGNAKIILSKTGDFIIGNAEIDYEAKLEI
jgi:diaminopimelate epimerase